MRPAETLVHVRGFPTPAGPIDLDVHAGEVVRIVGPNGSGKTSLLRAIAGLDAPVRPAYARIVEHDPRALPPRSLAERLTLVPQDARDGLVGLTAAGEARLRGVAAPVGFPQDRASTTLSSGEARRLLLAVARGAVWLLDEPGEGLDRDGLERLRDAVRSRRRDGAVILVDPTGDVEADRDIVLAPTPRPEPWRIPAPPASLRLVAPACRIRLGRGPAATEVPLPAVVLPAGLHAVVGPNGSGKTTLLRRLAGRVAAEGAAATWDGRPAADAATYLDADPMAWATEASVADALRDADAATVAALVPTHLSDRHPWALSGGEARRCGLARTLGSRAAVVLLDEPEAHLDDGGRAALGAVIARRVAAGACIVVATHDEAVRAAAQSELQIGGAS